MYINKERQTKFNKYFIPKEEGVYNIILKFESNFTDCSYMFAECENIIEISFISFNTENCTNMEYMFRDCKNLEKIYFIIFNTKNVTNMRGMFYECNSLKELNLSSFDTKNVTNMSKMFYYCTFLNCLNLNSFETNNVTDMSHMFYNCRNLNNLDVSNFNTDKVSNFNDMFNSCTKLEYLSLFNVNINKIKNFLIKNKDTEIKITFEYMFFNCINLKIIDFCKNNSNITNNYSDITKIYYNNLKVSEIFPNDNYINNKISSNNIESEKNSESISFINMSHMCQMDTKLQKVILFDYDKNDVCDNSYMFEGCNNLEKTILPSFNDNSVIIINKISESQNSENINNMDNNNNLNQISIKIKINETDVNKEIYFLRKDESKNTNNSIYNNDNLNKLNDSNVETYINGQRQDYFNRFFKPDRPGEYDIKLKLNIDFNDYSYMCAGCENNIEISFFSNNPPNITKIKYILANCKNLKKINFLPFDKNDLKNMNDMPSEYESLERLCEYYEKTETTDEDESFYSKSLIVSTINDDKQSNRNNKSSNYDSCNPEVNYLNEMLKKNNCPENSYLSSFNL